jgi:peroxiredoxin
MRRVLIVFAALCLSTPVFAQSGRRAPGFSLPDVNNQQHDLQDYRGKLAIVEIMRSDCPGCRAFSQKLEQIKTYYGGKVAVVAITNPPDAPSGVAKFIAEQKITYPILFDCGQVAFSYIRPNPLRPNISIPHIYLVDRDGVIRADFELGPDTQEIFAGAGLYKEIDRILGIKR